MDHPSKPLTHLDPKGHARMVDVSDKEKTVRKAVAEGSIRMAPETLAAIQTGDTPKGEVLQVARLAGIQAGKRTGELIPLCHLLPGTSLAVDVEVDSEIPGVRVRSTATLSGQTGVEMEALTATAVALLTVYDMVKSMDRSMVMEGIRLISKEGGRSGRWTREDDG
ncbi:MAG: cyclic pyranopterin monophosphate synthase MoaC [Gemmatimonadota bacterium]